ncbi:MAG: AmmeMemoRadiSam system protein A [Acidiferrobacterales bacterium]|nr:AmmeMemoRadiSam system protein A [Acidiferrobacterales bacterium]
MSSVNERFTRAEKDALLEVAQRAVIAGLRGEQLLPELHGYPEQLTEPGASFVTLNKTGQLRGCIGSLEAHQPLVIDIAHNAYAAAFRDPRFPALQQSELELLEFHLSVLSKPEPMPVESETELLSRVRPHVDGLILEEGYRRGTFLPVVWESLPDPAEFVTQLKRKAGLPMDYWSDTIRISRYTAEHIS